MTGPTAATRLLRDAARILREEAWPASRGPWVWKGPDSALRPHSPGGIIESQPDEVGHTVAEINPCADHRGMVEHDGRYIARVHPPVALQLAIWLDWTAAVWEVYGQPAGPGAEPPLNMARSVLRAAPLARPCGLCHGARVLPMRTGGICIEPGTPGRWAPVFEFAPCPDCCCTECGATTDTPPQCATCAIDQETKAKRKADR
jgi:hypothetical protein